MAIFSTPVMCQVLIGRVSERDALTQQAIAAALLLRERQGLYRSIAETLERLCTSSLLRHRYMEDLAYHCYEAGMWEQALAYCLKPTRLFPIWKPR